MRNLRRKQKLYAKRNKEIQTVSASNDEKLDDGHPQRD